MGKRKCLSLDDKWKILNEVDEGKKRKTEIAKEFDLPLSSLSTIIKNAEKIRSDKHALSRKKIRACPNEELDQVLVKWFAEMTSSNSTVPVSGPIIKAKVLDLAKKMGIDGFTASNGWLDRFRKRHIVFKRQCGESGGVDDGLCADWTQRKLPTLRKSQPRL
ncbi:Uncharacterised protein r2_g3012 [Pycnogonum litorale]